MKVRIMVTWRSRDSSKLGLSVAYGGDSEVGAKLLIFDLGSGYKASGLIITH